MPTKRLPRQSSASLLVSQHSAEMLVGSPEDLDHTTMQDSMSMTTPYGSPTATLPPTAPLATLSMDQPLDVRLLLRAASNMPSNASLFFKKTAFCGAGSVFANLRVVAPVLGVLVIARLAWVRSCGLCRIARCTTSVVHLLRCFAKGEPDGCRYPSPNVVPRHHLSCLRRAVLSNPLKRMREYCMNSWTLWWSPDSMLLAMLRGVLYENALVG